MFTIKSAPPAAGTIGLVLLITLLLLSATPLWAGSPARDAFNPTATHDAFTATEKSVSKAAVGADLGKYDIVVDSESIYSALTTGKGYINLQIKFKSGSAQLSADARMQLQQISTALQEKGLQNQKIMIIGHTDNVGPAAANQKLSEKRALQVKKILIKSGIDKTRLESSGRGESEPVADNNSADGRSQNRRVTLAVIK